MATEVLEDVMVVPRDIVLRTEDGYQVYVLVESADGPVAEATIAFYESPAGKRMVSKQAKLVGETMRVTQDWLVIHRLQKSRRATPRRLVSR